MTERVPFPFTPEDDARVAQCLRTEGLLAFPTETVYGLGGNALSEAVVRRVYEAKGRAGEKALPVLATPEQVWELAVWDDPRVDALMAQFWPGPLTLVLPAHPQLPEFLRGPNGTIAVRHSPAPVVQALLKLGGTPLIGTSANRSGGPAPITAAEVRAQLGGDVDRIIDAGECPGGVPSTVLDATRPVPVLLRAGAVALAQIEQAIGMPVTRGR